MGAVTTGTAGVDQAAGVGNLHLGRQLAHDAGGGGDLADAFLLDAQANDDGGDHDRRDFAAHDLLHQGNHFVAEDLAVFDHALEGGLRGHCLCSSRKFLSRS